MNKFFIHILSIICLLLVGSPVYGQSKLFMNGDIDRYMGLDKSHNSSTYTQKSSPKSKAKRKQTEMDARVRVEIERANREAAAWTRREAAERAELVERAKAERIKKEMEFQEKKQILQKSMRGLDNDISRGLVMGLRGLRDDDVRYGKRGSISNGLRGLSDDNLYRIKMDYNSEDYREEDHHQQYYVNSFSPSYTRTPDLSRNPTQRNNSPNTISPRQDVNHIQGMTRTLMTLDEYTRYVSVAWTPKPVYCESRFWVMTPSVSSDKSWLDKVESKVWDWQEQGKHKLLVTAGDELAGFAKKTVSSSSAVGVQIMKVYDIIKDIVGVQNLQVNIVQSSINAIKESAITGNHRYVKDVNRQSNKQVNDYENNYLVKKRLLFEPIENKTRKKVHEVNHELLKGMFERWIGLGNSKKQ